MLRRNHSTGSGLPRLILSGAGRGPRHPCRALVPAPAILSAACLLLLPAPGYAQDDPAKELIALRAEIQRELAKVKLQERKLNDQVERLDRKNRLLDEQLRKLRAAGTAPVVPRSSSKLGRSSRPRRPYPASAGS